MLSTPTTRNNPKLYYRIQPISWSLLLLVTDLFNFETEKQKNTKLHFGVLASDTVQSGKVPTNVSGDTVTTAKTSDLLSQ